MMRHRFILTTILLMLLFAGYAQQKTASKLSSLDWLLGNWQMEKKNGLLTESWRQIDDSTFDESSYLQKASGEKKLLEKVQLVFRNNNFYYISTVSDQNGQQPVKFTITTHSKEKFIAENPGHDYPKRILYEVINHDSIHARIDGGPLMPEKKSDFYYSRQTEK